MRLAVCSLLALVACNSDNEGADYYVEPGGGGGTFGTMGGSLPDSGSGIDGGPTIAGRVCDISNNIRDWSICGEKGLDGVIVTIGSSSSTAREDGTFDIAQPLGSNLIWRASGNAQLASLMPFSADNTIPSIRLGTYQDLVNMNGITQDNGVGALFVRVVHGGTFVPGVTATISPAVDDIRYDDDAAAPGFDVDATASQGIVWFPNVAVGSAVTFTVTPPSSVGAPVSAAVTVENDTITFATVEIP